MVTAHNENYKELADLTYAQNKVLYCQKYGYPLFVKTTNFREGIAANFDKIHYLLEILENNSSIEWLWWLDTDALITNFNKTIEEFCDDKYHCVIGCEVHEWQLTEINNGSFFIRNSIEARELLREIINEESNHLEHPWTDQGSMSTVFNNQLKYRLMTKFVMCRAFNSLDYSYWDKQGWTNMSNPGRVEGGQWHHGDFVMHWAGYPNDIRLREIKKFLSSNIVY